MRAARLQAYGDTDQFKLEQVPDPVPGAGEVLVKVAASGLNPVDSFIRMGYLAKMVPIELPATIGLDLSGTVAAVGPDVTDYAVGDRVIGHINIGRPGAHAELAVVPLAGLAQLSADVGFAAGATLPLAGLTGRQAVDALGARRGDRVLVSGALGAVGRAAVQYLKELGAVPVAGVRGPRLSEGTALAGESIDMDAEPAAPDFDFAVSTSSPAAGNAIKHVRNGGTLTSVAQIPEGANAGDRIKIVSVLAHDEPKMLQAVADAAGRGELTIPVVATYPLAELGAAHKKLGEPHVGGKIIVTP